MFYLIYITIYHHITLYNSYTVLSIKKRTFEVLSYIGDKDVFLFEDACRQVEDAQESSQDIEAQEQSGKQQLF